MLFAFFIYLRATEIPLKVYQLKLLISLLSRLKALFMNHNYCTLVNWLSKLSNFYFYFYFYLTTPQILGKGTVVFFIEPNETEEFTNISVLARKRVRGFRSTVFRASESRSKINSEKRNVNYFHRKKAQLRVQRSFALRNAVWKLSFVGKFFFCEKGFWVEKVFGESGRSLNVGSRQSDVEMWVGHDLVDLL